MEQPKPLRKAVVTRTQKDNIAHDVKFTPQKFNELISAKGYEVYIDKALRCPCAVSNSGHGLPDCNNCLGIGWFFINRTETIVAVQAMKADVRYEKWTRDTVGTAKITARAVDKLCFMDRITLKEVEGYYNEILRSRKPDQVKNIAYCMYDIISIESLFLFENSTQKLTELVEGADYTLDPANTTKIIFANKFDGREMTMSIRYRHFQTYHIKDMNRDIVKVRTKGCLQPEGDLKEMPILGYAQKAHYMFDNIKYDESQRLLNNDTTP